MTREAEVDTGHPAPLHLFDTGPRTNRSPALHSEGHFEFLNRVDSVFFGRLRALLEEWYDRFPADGQAHVRGRIRSENDRDALSGFWELYLHEFLTRSALRVDYEPEAEAHSKRTDFSVVNSEHFFLEAAAIGPSDEQVAQARRERRVYDAINELESPDFFLWVDAESGGAANPPGRRLRAGLRAWLQGLNYQDIVRRGREAELEDPPTWTWSHGGWAIRFRAITKENARGKPGVRPLGVLGPRAIWMDCHMRIRRVLASKRRTLDAPYVIAVLCDGFAVHGSEESVNEALYGSFMLSFDTGTGQSGEHRGTDGFFSPQKNRSVSALLSCVGLNPFVSPTTLLQKVPSLWLNPWAAYPLTTQLPAAKCVVLDLEQGTLRVEHPVMSLPELFGLEPDWPGPEDLRPDS